MSLQDVEMIFRFIGGLGMFLYGMHVMSDGLQKSVGNKVKRLMQVLTDNRFMAVLAGIAVTADPAELLGYYRHGGGLC